MPLGFKVKPTDRGVQRSLTRLRGFFDDMRPALNSAAKELTRRVWYRFAFKRDPDGKRWQPWAESTKEAAKRDPKRKLMLWTRRLRDNSRFIAGRKDLRAVIGAPYGVYHEQPDGKPSRKLPRRAFLMATRNGRRALSAGDEKMLLGKLQYQVRKAREGR